MSGNKKGFTLIELLIVVVIIGILAAIAIPKFTNTKEKAYIAAMKSDLRNLTTNEESYAADNAGSYTASQTALGFTPSTGVVSQNSCYAWAGTAGRGFAPIKSRNCRKSRSGTWFRR